MNFGVIYDDTEGLSMDVKLFCKFSVIHSMLAHFFILVVVSWFRCYPGIVLLIRFVSRFFLRFSISAPSTSGAHPHQVVPAGGRG